MSSISVLVKGNGHYKLHGLIIRRMTRSSGIGDDFCLVLTANSMTYQLIKAQLEVSDCCAELSTLFVHNIN